MQLTQSTSMRQEMRQLLTPRMIQSMEILQLPLLALEERIEQELENNPVLELQAGDSEPLPEIQDESTREEYSEGERALVVKEDSGQAEDFERLSRIADYLENEEFNAGSPLNHRVASSDGERDKKMDAMNNTAARGVTLQEHLLGQWAFVECSPEVRKAGEAIINSIDDTGYLRVDLETIRTESKQPLEIADLQEALELVQTLEPAGVGARSPQECLLLQLDALESDEELADGHDFDLERRLVSDHLKDLEMNRYPQISKKLGRDIEDIKAAVKRLSRLHPHPGKQIGADEAFPVTPDAIIYYDEETDRYEIEMANDAVPSLSISGMYRKMLKDRAVDKKTREFLTNNVRNARWLIDSSEQRTSTPQRRRDRRQAQGAGDRPGQADRGQVPQDPQHSHRPPTQRVLILVGCGETFAL
jgi:RNA polymerase sigma-54 factor